MALIFESILCMIYIFGGKYYEDSRVRVGHYKIVSMKIIIFLGKNIANNYCGNTLGLLGNVGRHF